MLYIISIVRNLFALLELLIISRMIMDFLRASEEALFTQWVHRATDPLLGPFVGIFPPADVNGFLLEFDTISALVVYALLGYAVSGGLGVLADHISHMHDDENKPRRISLK